MFEVLEGDKLDDVPQDGLPLRRTQDPVVPVQYLHVGEVGVPHADDDDRHGQVGGVHDGLPRVRHVGDDAVCQDQQDEVLLRDGGGDLWVEGERVWGGEGGKDEFYVLRVASCQRLI